MNTKRERMLAIGVGALAALYVGNWAYESLVESPLQSQQVRIDRASAEVGKREADLRRARRALRDLSQWQTQSLPSDAQLARSLYQNWLLDLVNRAGLTGCTVDSSEPSRRQGLYQSLTFSLRGRGTLVQITRLLYEFYRADHLHQIQTLSLVPLPGLEQLDLSASVEALILPGADQTNALNSRIAQRQATVRLADYDAIVNRNLFGIGSVGADPADDVYLTAVTADRGQREAWFTLRDLGNTLKLRSGDRIDVGSFHGRIFRIDVTEVIVEAEGERWLLTLGDNLAAAAALPPEF